MHEPITVEMKLGDTGRKIQAYLRNNSDGQPYEGLEGSTVSFKARKLNADGAYETLFELDAAIVDVASALIEYDPEDGWFSTVGHYYTDFKLLKNGARTSFPSEDEYVEFEIVPE